MNGDAVHIQRAYLILLLLHTLAASFIWGINTLFLLDAGLSNGQAFTALNCGPVFKFNEVISFQVSCKSQEEVDYYWEKLSEGGDEKAQQCGWLKDKYGVSWQIVPAVLGEMLQDNDAEVSNQVMKALLQMKKLDIKKLKQAYAQR